MNKNMFTSILQTVTLGTFLVGLTSAEGRTPKKYPETVVINKYPDAINEPAQAEKCILTAQSYLKKIHFNIPLKDLQVYELELNSIEQEETKSLSKFMATLKPYELGYLRVVLLRYFHSRGYDIGKNDLILRWDEKNNSYIDQIEEKYHFVTPLMTILNKIQTQRGLQKVWAMFLLFAGHEEQLFPPRIFTLNQAENFVIHTLDYLKIYNFETNVTLKKNQVTDTLSSAQRAEHTLNQILKDVVEIHGDYARKYSRIICLYFLHSIGFDWDAKRKIINWDGKNNIAVNDVMGNFPGSDVRDFLLPKLQKYFSEATEEELQYVSPACDRVGCE